MQHKCWQLVNDIVMRFVPATVHATCTSGVEGITTKHCQLVWLSGDNIGTSAIDIGVNAC